MDCGYQATGAVGALAPPAAVSLESLADGQEQEQEEQQEDESSPGGALSLGAFGGFGGSMDGGSYAPPLSPPAKRDMADADGGVDPEKAGGENKVTWVHHAIPTAT